METFYASLALCVEFNGRRWSQRTKASDAELWCFLWSTPEWTIGLDLFNDDIRRQAITWTKAVQDILVVLEWTIE